MNLVVGSPPVVRRELGRWDLGQPGPTLLVLAGIHGNEPAGILAVQRLLSHLQEHETPVRGRVVAFAGNVQALAQAKRYLGRDLNRGWGRQAVAQLAMRPADLDDPALPEDAEQRELLRCFDEVLRTATGPVLFIDLHTSSADGPPFLCLADTIDNRRLGFATHVPIILGIEETLEGASLEWFADRGVAAMAVEGGQHQHPDTVGNHEAVLWQLLVRVGMLAPASCDLAPHRAHLTRTCGAVPAIVEIVHRHAIEPVHAFRMEPGFTNFAPVAKGALLAHDRSGEIRAPAKCHVLLPLYQPQGDDGFFLARRVRPFWLHVARCLRALRFDALLRFLPGVRRDPDDPYTLLADRRVARWFTTEIFHLLGFRRQRERDGRLAFSRRWSRPENRRL